MATWPESDPTPVYPLIVTPVWKTNIVPLGGAKEQRRKAWVCPKFNVQVNYKSISASEAETLWQFFMARAGRYEAFYIYDLALLASVSFSQATPLYCATADGTTTIYDIPGRATSDQTICVDGVEDGSASILTGGGDGASDRASWAAAPAEGAIISATFTGYLRMRVRFAQDALDRELFLRNLFNYLSISLTGV